MTKLAPKFRGLRELVLHVNEMRASERGWGVVLEHLETVEHLDLTMGDDPERWLEMLVEKKLSLQTLSVPGWISKPIKARLTKAFPDVEFRSGERRLRYDRELGYYV